MYLFLSLSDFGAGEAFLEPTVRRGATAGCRGCSRPQAVAVPGKDADAEMKAVGDALTVCATCDRLDERAAQLGLDGSTRAKREKQARYEERSGRYVQLLEQPMPQHLSELCGAVDEGFNLAGGMVVDGKEMLLVEAVARGRLSDT